MPRSILSLLLLGVSVAAVAQTPPSVGVPPPGGPGRGGILMRADANGDGIVTREEAIAAADARFDRLDADRDGLVTPEEMRAARAAMRKRRGFDNPPPPPPSDRTRPPERTLTREEAHTRALEAFARADANGDGKVDRAEVERLRPMHRPSGSADGDMPPPPPQD